MGKKEGEYMMNFLIIDFHVKWNTDPETCEMAHIFPVRQNFPQLPQGNK
jgi:hypothetical protein